MTCTNLATAHEVSHGTIHNILQGNMGLEKKPARWAPKLVSEDQKQQRTEICKRFIAVFSPHFMTMLENILMMDKTLVSYHAYVTKKQSEQCTRTENQGSMQHQTDAWRSSVAGRPPSNSTTSWNLGKFTLPLG
jgi:sensor domain CHASE-containing protein